MSEVADLEVIILSLAEGNGFATTGAAARAMGGEVGLATDALNVHAGTHRNVVVPAHAATTSELKKTEEALHHATIALGENGAAWEGASRRLGGIQGLMGMGLGMGAVGLGGAAAFGVLAVGARSAVENFEKLDASTRLLSQAFDSQGLSLQKDGSWIDEFIRKNQAYITNQYAARESIASLTRAGYDQSTVQRITNDALDLATIRHVSLDEASRTLNLALQGNTRGLRDLGLSASEVSAIMKEAPNSMRDVAKAQAEVEKASAGLQKAQQALRDEEDALAGKRVKSKLDLDHLAEKQAAVAKEAANLAKANNDLSTAQNGVVVTAQSQLDLLNKVEPKLKDGRNAATDYEQSSNRLNMAWQNSTAKEGPAYLELLAKVKGGLADIIVANDKWVDQHKTGPLTKLFSQGAGPSGAGPLGNDPAPGNAPQRTGPAIVNEQFDKLNANLATFQPRAEAAVKVTFAQSEAFDRQTAAAVLAANGTAWLREGSDRAAAATESFNRQVAQATRTEDDLTRGLGQATSATAVSLEGVRMYGKGLDEMKANASAAEAANAYMARNSVQGIQNIREVVAQANRDRLEIKVNSKELDDLQWKINSMRNSEINVFVRSERDMSGGGPGVNSGINPFA